MAQKNPIHLIGLGTSTKFILTKFLEQPLHNIVCHLVDTTVANDLPERIAFHQIGQHAVRGLGCGGNADLGQKAAEESLDTLWSLIPAEGQVVFFASMAGGTGAGVLPIMHPLAAKKKSQAAAFVTMPLVSEGPQRTQTAAKHLKRLDDLNDLFIVEPQHLAPFLPTNPLIDQRTIYDLLNQIVLSKTIVYLCG